MKPQPQGWAQQCRIVVGAAAVRSLRAHSPAIPIVALVDESCPTESVLAQTAGADVVLALPQSDSQSRHPPGLELAVQAACTMARRRSQVARTSGQVSHDVAQALNVITLAAEAGGRQQIDPEAALEQIAELARVAGADAWRAGHASRAGRRVLTGVGLRRLILEAGFDRCSGTDVRIDVVAPGHETLVFADEQHLVGAITEMIDNAERSGADWIQVAVVESAVDGRVDVVVSDNGCGLGEGQQTALGEPFNTGPDSDRLGLGLATLAEYGAELGGELALHDPGGHDGLTRLALSLPTIDSRSAAAIARVPTVDQAAAQADILERVVRHAPLNESLEAVVAAIEHQLPEAICSVLLLEPDLTLHHIAGARLPATYRDSIDGLAIGPGQGSCGTAAYIGQPVVAGDVTVDHHWTDFRHIATAHGLRSCWSTPIVAAKGAEVLGTFAVYTPVIWEPDPAATRLVERFTYLAAVAIEHHRLFGALAESEARFRSAFEGTAAGIALVGTDGVFLKVNPALSDLVGHDPTWLVGTNLLDLFEPSHRDLVMESWAHVETAKGAAPSLRSVDVALKSPGDAAPVWLSLRTSLIAGESDSRPYLYVEVRDITAARKQQIDLRAREAAEAANQAKSDFLALVSHELRTPLNVVLGFAQVMQLVDLDGAQQRDSVDQIVQAGRHLRGVIDGLLDLSRIESGQLRLATEPVVTGNVVGEALELVRPLASSRDIELIDRTKSEAVHSVVADPRCLRQVLINLVDNAVKYTPEGGLVEVSVTACPDGSSRISVTDSGSGIAPESLEDVFQPFHRLGRRADERDDTSGTGLGLALCVRLMQEMGGSIGVTSTVGVGSCFWVDLPTSTCSTPVGVAEFASGGATIDGDRAQTVDALNQ